MSATEAPKAVTVAVRKDALTALAQAGADLECVAAAFGVDPNELERWALNVGLRKRQGADPSPDPRTPRRRDAVLARLRAGESVSAVAAACAVRFWVVKRIAQQEGLAP
ncbi:MAG: hypothetical protein NW200_03930 [Hyphomonadaceae bacterium]|nr:hypothetical protein [Hyphomonadaceae bacterium]